MLQKMTYFNSHVKRYRCGDITISALSGDNRETRFLFQRISVVVQRFNSVLLRESFSADSRPEDDQQ